MSNPAVCFLSRTHIGEIHLVIEDNLGESIHIHYGNVRINMSVTDFLRFSEKIIHTTKELFLIRNLSWSIFDKESFKDEWMYMYAGISNLTYTKVAIKNLFIKESYVHCRSIKRIIHLYESGYISLLKNESNDMEYYEEAGQYEPSRKEKILYIKQHILEEGYLFNGNPILIDQDGYILDGIKRASVLYYLNGGCFTIPVLKIQINWEKNLEERRQKAENEVKMWEIMHRHLHSSVRTKKTSRGIELEEIVEDLNRAGISYVIHIKNTIELKKILYAIVLVQSSHMSDIGHVVRANQSTIDPNYTFAYATNQPILYESEKGAIIVADKYCVKSKFIKNMMVPLEKNLQAWLWENRKFNNIENYWDFNDKAKLIITIIECVLEGKFFSEKDKLLIEENRKFLNGEKIENILKPVFFSYSNALIKNLLSRKYEEAVSGYIRFAKY